MSSLNGVFNIAKSALMTSQKALNVTSHNISNANTEGYTRQRAVLAANNPVTFGGLQFGTGVSVTAIERVYDSFQTVQLRSAVSLFSNYETAGRHLYALESILNDFDGSGLSSRLDALFNSFQELAANPSSYGERSSLIARATVLADTINSVDSAIRDNISNIRGSIEAKVGEINGIASEIAGLNQQISATELSGMDANDLRDRRDVLLEDLSKLVDVSVAENEQGQVDVFLGGSFIVAGVKSSEMTAGTDPDSTDSFKLYLNGASIESRISSGSIKGDIDGYAYFKDAHSRINLLAASLVKEVNLQHSAGWGLDGSTGVDFFTPLSVSTRSAGTNQGGAVISGGAITDLSQVTLDDYEIRFSGPGAYTVFNIGQNSVVATGAYTSGSAIGFDGLSVTITDGTRPPAAGDKFMVSATENAARDFSVAVTDPDKIAASSTSAGIPGDNTNATALAELRDKGSINGASFGSFYNRVVTDLGTSASNAKARAEAQKIYMSELRAARDSVSGVSIEEEAINLVKLQRAYEAAAKVMSTVDQMLETLLSIR
ncbi:MAG: flagellar hook-associated protein FlgK [Deltaproteobacteria bacterium]|nr:flagellar hook-associated protein FlgK [Deltaproteobacteria bacterium]MBZ0219253.1 flagellar hook-associated protein FlgK [Deltaproteobacteria bacterium]